MSESRRAAEWVPLLHLADGWVGAGVPIGGVQRFAALAAEAYAAQPDSLKLMLQELNHWFKRHA